MPTWPAAHPAPEGDGGEEEGLLVIHPAQQRPVWRTVEQVLGRLARHWRLLDAAPEDEGLRLDYRVRLSRGISGEHLLAEVLAVAGPDIVAARLESMDQPRPRHR